MKQSIKSRIAPTPSGFLHIGNAYNFLITYRETVHKRAGELTLRIDDLDSLRIRDEYINDIFTTLKWLNIPYISGPKNLDDFKKNYSQSLKIERYFDFVKKLPGTYACHCSRSQLKEAPCGCVSKNNNFVKGQSALRLNVKDQEVRNALGDFVLWRKDDLPSYQVASLVDDIDNGINLIIRGEDLLSSTKAQFLIADLAGDKVFTKAHFLHHPLIKGDDDSKISKSQKQHQQSSFLIKDWIERGKSREDLLKYFNFSSWDHFINE